MASQTKPSRVSIDKILLATDFSPESNSALKCAVSLARRNGSLLLLTHVLPSEGSLAATESKTALSNVVRRNAEKSMAELESTEDLRFLPHEVIIRSGDAWDAISQAVTDKNVDLVVMGTQGHGGITKLLLGSTAERVIRHARCPVLTVGPNAQSATLNRFGHVLCASDFRSGSTQALKVALSLAENERAELTLLHVVASDPGSDPMLLEWKHLDREKLKRMVPRDADLALEPHIEVEVGIPEVEILRLAASKKAELIVMGCHFGGSVSAHLPWTTLHHVLQHAHCPVLTVRGEVSAGNVADDIESAMRISQ